MPDSTPTPALEETRLIKRYSNRKLYDTTDSRYVTLHQIAEFVSAGEEVRIVDNTTKEDLTNVTLAQIIYEQEKRGANAKRSRNLREFIQDGRERILDSLREGPMGKLVTKLEDESDESSLGAPDASPQGEAESDADGAVAETKMDWKHPKDALDELGRLADDRVRSIVQGATGTIQQLQTEVKRLQVHIEELEERLVRRKPSDDP